MLTAPVFWGATSPMSPKNCWTKRVGWFIYYSVVFHPEKGSNKYYTQIYFYHLVEIYYWGRLSRPLLHFSRLGAAGQRQWQPYLASLCSYFAAWVNFSSSASSSLFGVSPTLPRTNLWFAPWLFPRWIVKCYWTWFCCLLSEFASQRHSTRDHKPCLLFSVLNFRNLLYLISGFVDIFEFINLICCAFLYNQI